MAHITLPHVARHDLAPRVTPARATERVFLSVTGLLFALSATVTVVWCASMSAMGEMPMPGGWTMSMVWVRMPGQSWPGTAASFLGMWIVMTVAMMLPSLVPTLSRYRQGVAASGATPLGWLTALFGAGYFFVWSALGSAVFFVGVTLAAIEMQQPALSRVVPLAAGVVVLSAGVLQFTAWKARHLACCREEQWPDAAPSEISRNAGRHGVRLGVHCSCSCLGAMAILLAIGLMDIRAMAIVTAVVTIERLAPAKNRVAQAIGALAITGGIALILLTVVRGSGH